MYEIEYHNFSSRSNSNQSKARLIAAAKAIITNIDSGNPYYQIFQPQSPDKILKPLIDTANRIRNNFSDLIVISMGGATLNPQMLLEFVERNQNNHKSPRIHFLHNTDPWFFDQIMQSVNLSTTAFLAISNSGQTLETNALVGCIAKWYQQNGFTDLASRAFFITDPATGMLKDIATRLAATLLAHPAGISGRYSGLSSVSLFTGMIAGINVEAYLTGAAKVIRDFRDNLDQSKTGIGASSLYSINRNIIVNIGYLQRFAAFLEWYSQIIAESLGKDGKGYTPVRGIGPNDQHSMLQLYLDGPQDKIFSLFHVSKNCKSSKLQPFVTAHINELGYLMDRNLSELNWINFEATMMALKSKKLPVRTIIIDELSAENFGALVCHFMLEVVIIGHLIQVNSFNQPGVELVKQYTKELVK